MNQLHKTIFKLLFILVGIAIFGNSCIVSKKKYKALEASQLHQTDSLQKIIQKSKNEYNRHRYMYVENDAKKSSMIDSLDKKNRKLSLDSSKLQSQLYNIILDYTNEKNNLKRIELDLYNKSKQIDALNYDNFIKESKLKSITNVLNNQIATADSISKLLTQALTEIDSSEYSITSKNGKVYIVLEEKLLFKSSSFEVLKKGNSTITTIAKVLEPFESLFTEINAHTDNTGTAENNLKLSSQRAIAVLLIFQNNSTIKANRLSASGKGSSYPITDISNNELKEKNRRVEIIIMPNLDFLYKIIE